MLPSWLLAPYQLYFGSVIDSTDNNCTAATVTPENDDGDDGVSDEAIIPQINGSVSVANEASNFINENVRVPFVEAAQTAQGQVANGIVLGVHLGMVQGYLVYKFFVVANNANQAGHLTVIDAGNGNMLYTSEGHPLGSFGHSSIFGPRSGGGYDDGGWSGPWMREWQ